MFCTRLAEKYRTQKSPLLRRYRPTHLCDGAQMAIFGDFFASCVFSEPRAAGFRPASYVRTKATPCAEVWQTFNLRRLRLGEEKREKDRKIVTTGQKYNGPLFHTAAINSRQKSPSGHHRTNLSGYIFPTKAHIDNRKKLVKQQYLLHTSNMANFGPLTAEIG